MSVENQDDNQLITEYLQGREQALEILINKYLGQIYGFVYRLTGKQEEAEDITQEAFVKVWRSLKRFDKKKSFKPWLFKIAKNTAMDFLRKRKILLFSDLDQDEGNSVSENIPDPSPLPSEVVAREDFKQNLGKVLEKLPLAFRSVISLYYDSGLNFREIAEITGESLNTVKSRQRRALFLLRRLLGEEFKF